MSAVSNAPGTSTTGKPARPHVRYRVTKPPPLTRRSPVGRDTGPSVARLYPKLAAVTATASTTTVTATRRSTRRPRPRGRGPGLPAQVQAQAKGQVPAQAPVPVPRGRRRS